MNEQIRAIILFLLLLILAIPVFNALNSIIMVIAILLLMSKYKILKIIGLPKTVIFSFSTLVTTLIISSLAINDGTSFNYAVKFVYWMLPFFVVFYNIQLCNNDKIPLYSFALSLFISAMAVIYQYYFLDKIRPGGLYFQPNHFASMMDILLPFATMFIFKNAYECKDKFFVIISFLPVFLGFYALFLSGSRGGLLGVFLGFLLCIVCYALRNLKLTYVFLTLSSVIILFVATAFIAYDFMPELFQRRYDIERLLLIESSYNMWNDNKVFGVGLSNWEEEYNDKYKLPQAKEKLDMPHNILAFFFSTSGLIGGIGYIVFIVGIFVFLIRYLHKCKNKQIIFIILAMLWGLFAINIHGMVDVGLNNKFVMRLFSGVLGLTAAYVCLEEQKEDCVNDGNKG